MSELELAVRLPFDRFELRLEVIVGAPVTGIFGASGAGKSSLLEIVAGLRRGARGRVRLGDEVWLDSERGIDLPPERRAVGYVPQDGLLFPHLDVRQNLLAGAERSRRAGGRPAETLATVAELLELVPLLDRAAPTLSGGERQRVALGRALCSGPRLLLLDEPLAALDLPLRRRLLVFLRRLRAGLTVPMLLVSHDPIEVQALCDELLVLRRGEVIARGEPRAVLTDPAIFPLAEEEGFENLLPGRLVRRGGRSDVVELGAGVELVTGGCEVATGSQVLVGLSASDILLASEEPRGLSARNVFASTVVAVRRLERLDLVTVDLGASIPPLAVEITAAMTASLGLAPGRPVFVVFKAASCRIYGEVGRRREEWAA